jgi:hypothetical protein
MRQRERNYLPPTTRKIITACGHQLKPSILFLKDVIRPNADLDHAWEEIKKGNRAFPDRKISTGIPVRM